MKVEILLKFGIILEIENNIIVILKKLKKKMENMLQNIMEIMFLILMEIFLKTYIIALYILIYYMVFMYGVFLLKHNLINFMFYKRKLLE